jgi:hypothetical protein
MCGDNGDENRKPKFRIRPADSGAAPLKKSDFIDPNKMYTTKERKVREAQLAAYVRDRFHRRKESRREKRQKAEYWEGGLFGFF